MPDPKQPADGPSLETYLETRLNLLAVSLDKLEFGLRERIDAVEEAGLARKEHLESEIAHAKQLLQTAQETAQRATDKSESTQHLHNVEANNWRAEYNKLKSEMTPKDEFQRLDRDFSAYRLEVSRLLAAAAGEKTGTKESKETSLATIAIIVAAVGVVSGVLGSVLATIMRPMGHG